MPLFTAYCNNQLLAIHEYDEALHRGKVVSVLGKPLLAKRGAKVVHHFAHKHTEDRDDWLDPLMTEWHRRWQRAVSKEHIERRIEKEGKLHIADIVSGNGRVLELQHSPITPETITQREEFYGESMIWMFDFTATSSTTLLSRSGVYELYQTRMTRRSTSTTTYYDMGTHLLKVLWWDRSESFFVGVNVKYSEFCHDVLEGITTSLQEKWLEQGDHLDEHRRHNTKFLITPRSIAFDGLETLLLYYEKKLPSGLELTFGGMKMAGRKLIPRCCWCQSEVTEKGLTLLLSECSCEGCSSPARFYVPNEGRFCPSHLPTAKCELCSSLPDGIDPLVFIPIRKELACKDLQWAVTTTNPQPYYPYIFSFNEGNDIVVVNDTIVLSDDLKQRITKRRREGRRVLVLKSDNINRFQNQLRECSPDLTSEEVKYFN